jgi:hypothetical protein
VAGCKGSSVGTSAYPFVEKCSTVKVFSMDKFLSVDDVSVATGQPVRRLRAWCATGKVPCDKVDGQWVISLSEVPRIAVLARQRERSIDEGRSIAAIVPVSNATEDLPGEIARRLGLAERSVSTSTLSLDGTEYLVAVWKASERTPQLAPVVELVEQLGGELLDGEVRHEAGG